MVSTIQFPIEADKYEALVLARKKKGQNWADFFWGLYQSNSVPKADLQNSMS